VAQAVRTYLIRIGNSRGVRLPKAILEQAAAALEHGVGIEVRDVAVVMRAAAHPRAGWTEAFADIAAHGDDFILDAGAPSLSRWDKEEWEW